MRRSKYQNGAELEEGLRELEEDLAKASKRRSERNETHHCELNVVAQRDSDTVALCDAELLEPAGKGIALLVEEIVGQSCLLVSGDDADGESVGA